METLRERCRLLQLSSIDTRTRFPQRGLIVPTENAATMRASGHQSSARPAAVVLCLNMSGPTKEGEAKEGAAKVSGSNLTWPRNRSGKRSPPDIHGLGVPMNRMKSATSWIGA